MTHLEFTPDDDPMFPLMPDCSSFLQDHIQCGKNVGYARFDKIDGSFVISYGKTNRVYEMTCKKTTPVY